MNACNMGFSLDLVHIDVARNATDDFNLFHDKNNWNQIEGNPFGGPIALGFQLECFIENQVKQYRQEHQENQIIDEHKLNFSNYAFNFAGVVRPKESLTSQVKKSRLSHDDTIVLSNRIVLKNEQGIVLIGFKSESNKPLFASHDEFSSNMITEHTKDRSPLGSSGFFYKRKFTTNSNAKNFLTGSCVEQSHYFDELKDIIRFPETYCTSLISCALLEKAKADKLDFKKDPMVYTSHKISVNKTLVSELRSDQQLHLLVSSEINRQEEAQPQGAQLVSHHCYGFNQQKQLLFQGEIQLAPLSYILQ